MDHPYSSFVHRVQKPARYVGGELFQVRKDPGQVKVSICLAFPDVYDIGMSHLGTKILYKILNDNEDISCERAFAPWVDMEHELRERQLPLVSLENARPLGDFDVLGFSLQFEMTYTNILTILDLSGLALRATDRGEDDPLILGGGPCATHPEACAPFFDAFLIGDAEQRLPELLLKYKSDREKGLSKREALIEMAAGGGVYCPALYELKVDDRNDLLVVDKPAYDNVPDVVERAFVEDISKFPFPDDSPVATSEAIFDRLSIEIARGCTEGCRFCQAGMIYRPVRERDPNDIVETLVSAVEKGGFDEASLTSLSTADYSCIDPLIKKVMTQLRTRRVSLGVASLRAYGLNDSVLDEIRSVRATGLTFAPEAGTQRMRDVVNKNVSEDDIATSAHRVFSKGWDRMKLYFMIGLPTEEDEDVNGIVETGSRMQAIGRKYHGRRAQVTVSVSSHVPKPHTPFQWAAMDDVDTIRRKQKLLGQRSRDLNVKVRWHDSRVSYLEGIMARGDRRVADIIENAWKRGARFDSWDEQLRYDVWTEVLDEAEQVEPMRYLGTLPLDGKLPWDHIDVGLADGFLAQEWKRTLKNRLSPPCGKPAGDIVHHTNLEDAEADQRKLVCYHCGVACDMQAMADERKSFLKSLGALTPPEPPAEPTPAVRHKKKPSPPKRDDDADPHSLVRYRLQYVKTGLIRLQGHSDMLRILPRVMRRASLPVAHSWGFNPKPILSFCAALPLGTFSISELCDITLTDSVPIEELLHRLNEAADPGLSFVGARCLPQGEGKITKGLESADYLVTMPGLSREEIAKGVMSFMGKETFPVAIVRKKGPTTYDARAATVFARITSAADWPEITQVPPTETLVHLRLLLNVPCPRPQELMAALFEQWKDDEGKVVRMGFHRRDRDKQLRSPMEPPPEVQETESKPSVKTEQASAL